MSEKKRFKVTLNYHGEIHIFWLWTANEREALRVAIGKLAKELEKTYGYVRAMFLGSQDNYKIEEIEV